MSNTISCYYFFKNAMIFCVQMSPTLLQPIIHSVVHATRHIPGFVLFHLRVTSYVSNQILSTSYCFLELVNNMVHIYCFTVYSCLQTKIFDIFLCCLNKYKVNAGKQVVSSHWVLTLTVNDILLQYELFITGKEVAHGYMYTKPRVYFLTSVS